MKQIKTSGGYLTVFLTLLLAVMLSLCVTLIEGARRNGIYLQTECVMDIGMNSILAEYHRELFSQFNLFAIDCSYGTADAGKANTERHLRDYLEHNLDVDDVFLSQFFYRDFLGMSVGDVEIQKVSIMSDGNGSIFRQRAVDAVREDMGISFLEELKEWMKVVEDKELTERDICKEKAEVDAEIEEYDGTKVKISEKEWITVNIDNPTAWLEEKRSKGILTLVTEESQVLSDARITGQDLISTRMKEGRISKGNILQNEPLTEAESLLERFYFQEYLLRYLGYYGEIKERSALAYQLEYLIIGQENDLDNLKSIANRLSALREAANAVSIFSDEEKCMEAEIAATVIGTLLQIPDIIPLLKTTLLLGWAYAESVYDVKILLAGGRVPLIKDEQSWHYDLQNILNTEGWDQEQTQEEGLSYADYLRIFMMLTNQDTLTARAMDMVEADIRLTPGNKAFRMDACLTLAEAAVQINSSYGYEFMITRQRGY